MNLRSWSLDMFTSVSLENLKRSRTNHDYKKILGKFVIVFSKEPGHLAVIFKQR